MPDDYLLDLIPDDHGHLWAPGLRGIHRFEQAQLDACLAGQIDRIQSLTLGMRDGLLTPDCTSLHYPITAKTPDGRIWVATRAGVASFDPERIEVDVQPLTTEIEQIVANHDPVPVPASLLPSAPLRLFPGSGERLEFHSTATSLLAADRVKFRHRLEGYDADWSPASDLRLAFYTNLRPGAYRFEVKAANGYGIWSDTPTPLALIIAPHFWQTALFQWTVGFLVAAGVVLLHRQRLSVLRQVQAPRHYRALTTEKERIAADMHDEIGAALTQISILIEVAKTQTPSQNPSRAVLDLISQSAREVTARISDLVWATNPCNDTLDNLASYLREQIARQLESGGLRGRLALPGELPACHVSATLRRNVLLVAKEALSNTLKHSGATEFAAELTHEDGWLALRLKDNGRGFSRAPEARAGNGLRNMPRRMDDLGGTITLESAPGQGTCITLRVPLAHSQIR